MTFTEDLVGQPLSPASFKPQITALYYYTLISSPGAMFGTGGFVSSPEEQTLLVAALPLWGGRSCRLPCRPLYVGQDGILTAH